MNILKGTFSALRHRNYRLFFFGQLISLIGTWLQNTALSWLVYSVTKDSRALGTVAFAGSIPVLFLSLVAGTVADEYPKRRLLVMTQTASALLALVLAIAIWGNWVGMTIIVIVSVLMGVTNAFDLPTRQAFVVDMVGKEDLTNAVALNSAVFNSARLIGPMLGGIVIAFFSMAMCFFLNGVSYIAVIAGLMMMRFPKLSTANGQLNGKTKPRTSRLAAMKEGVNYLYRLPQLRALMYLVVAMTLFGWSYSVNLPVVAAEVLHGGSTTYGLLLSANGIGALLAALSMAAWAEKMDPRKMVYVGIGVFILSLGAIGLFDTQWPIMLGLVGTGWGIITFFITANTTLQRWVPDELRGRVMGIYSLSFAGLFPFGSLLAGFLAHQFGVRISFLINSAILLACAIPVFLYIRHFPRLSSMQAAGAPLEEDARIVMGAEQAATEAEQIARG